MGDSNLEDFNINIINYWVLIPAAFIILFLSFLEKRQRCHNCCDGRPALLIPFRFLDGYDNRTAYAMAFGTTTSTIVSLIMAQDTLQFQAPLWARALYIYLQAIIGSLTCFPLFACLTTRYRAFGAVLCILYSSLWLSLTITDLVKRVEDNANTTVLYMPVPPEDTFVVNLARAYEIMQGLPIIFCYIVLIGYCIYILHKCYQRGRYLSPIIQGSASRYQEDHVRWVLRKFKVKESSRLSPTTLALLNGDSSNESFIKRMRTSVKLRFFTNFPFFRYPVKIFALAFVMINVLYWTALLLIMTTIRILYEVFSDALTLGDVKDKNLIILIIVCAFVSLVVSIFSTVSQIFVSIRRYRYHILRLYQGDRSFEPKRDESTQYDLTRGMSFPGYQVGFMLWGLLMGFFFFLLMTLFIVIPIYLAVNGGVFWSILGSVAQLLSFPATVLVLFYLQVLMTKHVLLQNKLKPTDKFPPLNVDNRKFYEIVNYYSLFTNMAVGFFTCLWRIIESGFFGIVSVGRLDRSVFTRDLEHLDKGYTAYVSMLEVDNAHNNPSMRVFAHLLWTQILAQRTRRYALSDHTSDNSNLLQSRSRFRRYTSRNSPLEEVPVSPNSPNSPENTWTFFEIDIKVSKTSLIRWHLAYTLISNPQLRKLRKHVLGQDSATNSERVTSYNSDSVDGNSVTVTKSNDINAEIPQTVIEL